MGIGPVPTSAIDRRAAVLGIDEPDELDIFHAAMRAMDRVFLEDARRENDAPAPAPARQKVSSRPMTMGLFDALFS